MPLGVVDPVPRLLVVRVDVREPADAAPYDSLQVLAVLVQQLIVSLAQEEDQPGRSIYGERSPACRKTGLYVGD